MRNFNPTVLVNKPVSAPMRLPSFREVTCPGFPTDTCGNTAEGLFGYIALTVFPSGTLGAPDFPAAPSSFPPQPTTVAVASAVTVLETVTASPVEQVTTTSTNPSSFLGLSESQFTQSSTTSIISIPLSTSSSITAVVPSKTPILTNTVPDSLSSIGAASTWWASPYASIVTVTGEVQTVTVTPTAPPPSLETIEQINPAPTGGFFSNAGKVAGVFVAVALIIMALFVLVVWCTCCRGRNRNNINDETVVGDGSVSRRASKMSQLGFAVKRRSGDWKNLSRNSTSGLTSPGVDEKSPADTMVPVSRRVSGPMRVVDQRLDPNSLWNGEHSNGSHASINSFRDDRDYTRRVLQVANPDDE
ncbi:hypothetical protein MMC11_006729 [Xylographa trunciseda]|nr:hypothetical protein [Xylographa trunciseda]